MRLHSFLELVKCRWREFRREPSAFFWVIFMPVLWMVILGYSFSNPKPERYAISVTGKINSELQQKQIAGLTASPALKVSVGATPEEADVQLKRGESILAVDFSDLETRIIFDDSNSEAVSALRVVQDVLQNASGRKDVVTIGEVHQKTRGKRYIDFLVPGLIGLSVMTSSLFGIGMTLVSNRKENLLKRYLATPMRKSEFLLSHVVGRLIVFVFEVSVILLAGFILFRFSIEGNFSTFLLVGLVGAAAFTAIALLCASRTSSIPTMGGIINLMTLPMIMVSGVFYSKTHLPEWIMPFINILPLTALNDALRRVALEGASLSSVSSQLTILIGYFVISAALATKIFKWY